MDVEQKHGQKPRQMESRTDTYGAQNKKYGSEAAVRLKRLPENPVCVRDAMAY